MPGAVCCSENAGVPFRVELPDVDERAIEAAIDDSGTTPAELALILAEAKAIEVSLRFPEAIVIAADQTMNLGDRLFHKPADMKEARRNLIDLSGRTHELNSAVVIAEAGTAPWNCVDTAYMTNARNSARIMSGVISRRLATPL